MTQFKVGIFDMNGTLLNDLPVVYESVCEIFRQYGVTTPPTIDQYRNEITSNFIEFYRKYGVSQSAAPADLNKIRKAYLDEHSHRYALHPEAYRALNECQDIGLRLAVVSAAAPGEFEERIKQFDLAGYFETVYGNAQNKKEAFRVVLEKLGVKAEEAFYVDDTYDGIQSAKAMGLATFGTVNGYCTRERIKEAKPDYIISSLLAVPEALRLIAEMGSWKASDRKENFALLLARALEVDEEKTIAAIKNTYTFSDSAVYDMAKGIWHPNLDIQEYIIGLVAKSFAGRKEEK